MALRFARKTLLAVIEDLYGTEKVPTTAANSIETMDLRISPLEGETENRDIDRQALGNDLTFHTSVMRRPTFKTSLAGSGAAGTPPPVSPLLRMCGRDEVINAGTDVRYLRASSGYDSGSLYANFDGNLYRLIGARGTFVENYNTKRLAFLEWTIDGLWLPVTSAALPTLILNNWQKPRAINYANTNGFELHGVTSACLRSLQLTEGNQVEHIDVVGCEEIAITDRAPAGSITIEEQLASTKNWDQAIRDSETGNLLIQHGQSAGHIIERQFPRVQLLQPDLGEEQKRATRSMGLNPLPSVSAGDDEDVMIFR